MKTSTKVLIIGGGLLLLQLLAAYFTPTDTTDKSWYNRSGMSLYIDDFTGCHYLSVQRGWFGKGVLIPRKTAWGMHYCEER